MTFFESILSTTATLFSSDPAVFALQIAAVVASALVIYTVLYTTRDILLRSSSTLAQVGAILLVAALPIVGFFLYFLVRPSKTLFEKSLRRDLTELIVRTRETERKSEHLKILKRPLPPVQKFVKKEAVAATTGVEEAML